MVDRVSGVSINNSEGMKLRAQKRFLGGHVEGKDVSFPLKPWKHRVIGKKRHMNVGSDTWLPKWGKKGLKTIK